MVLINSVGDISDPRLLLDGENYSWTCGYFYTAERTDSKAKLAPNSAGVFTKWTGRIIGDLNRGRFTHGENGGYFNAFRRLGWTIEENVIDDFLFCSKCLRDIELFP